MARLGPRCLGNPSRYAIGVHDLNQERIAMDIPDLHAEPVVACYTDDLIYIDPNTRGAVEGSDAFGRYPMKLLSRWQMHWSVKETFPLADTDGAAGR
jgi:hypothetical protein